VSDTDDMWRAIRQLRQDVRELRGLVAALECQTPAARQARYEADVAAADLAESGYDDSPPIGADRHGPGCLCPYCPDESEPEPEDYDPGPEVDDEGGMSEYRYVTLPAEEEL
jgi:hypothetical protein